MADRNERDRGPDPHDATTRLDNEPAIETDEATALEAPELARAASRGREDGSDGDGEPMDGSSEELPAWPEEPPEWPERPSYRRGDSVGRYLILAALGEGAMGAVYSAYDPELDRKVALKLLRPDRGSKGRRGEARARKRLEREARAMARLSHPNVVQVHDAGVHERPARPGEGDAGERQFDVFLTMEHVEGVTLRMWQRSRPRPSWREIVRVYLDACRGLAAAHDAGMIHRDIKPGNILIGSDGRVRVADFGLAAGFVQESGDRGGDDPLESGVRLPRSAGAAPSSEGASDSVVSVVDRASRDSGPALSLSSSGSKLEARLDDHLTRTGTIMGTPSYMAPEQHQGGEVGPAADQYGVCVSLYQALYGVRPFSWAEGLDRKASMRELLRVKLDGAVAEPPADSDVPSWVAAVVRRGLAPMPEDRHATMHALIAALENDPARRRRWLWRRVGVAVAVVGLVGVALFGWLREAEPVDACAGIDELMNGVWDDGVRQRTRDAFLATRLPYAPDTIDRVIQRLDPYAATWLELREAQCRAPDDGLAPARTICMIRRREQLAALVQLLGPDVAPGATTGGDPGPEPGATPGPGLVSRAVQLVGKLPPVEDCSDEDYLTARVPPPEDGDLRRRVEALQPRVARLKTLYDAGEYAAGLTEGESLLGELGEGAHAPLLAEVLHIMAQLKFRASAFDEAEELMKRSIHAAARGRDAVFVARGWSMLIFIVGSGQKRLDDARALGEWVEMLAILAGDELSLANALSALAVAHDTAGQWQEARVHMERALAIRERSLGADHPDVGASLQNVAVMLSRIGDFQGARAAHERALAIKQEAVGKDHPDTAWILNNLGLVLWELGEYERARDSLERALEIGQAVVGEDHPDVARSLSSLGFVLNSMKRYERARTVFDRAIAIWTASLGEDHFIVAYGLIGLGDVARAEGSFDEAERHLERALAMLEKSLGPDHPDLNDALVSLGALAVARGEPVEAVQIIERGMSLSNDKKQPALSLELARALWERDAPGDRPRAVELATIARDGFAARPNEPERARAAAWLDDHPLR